MSHLLIQTFSVLLDNPTVAVGNGKSFFAMGQFKLAPPYLRKLPGELVQHEREYAKRSLSLQTKAVFHFLWITFRVSYYFGWREACRSTYLMPHRKISNSHIVNPYFEVRTNTNC